MMTENIQTSPLVFPHYINGKPCHTIENFEALLKHGDLKIEFNHDERTLIVLLFDNEILLKYNHHSNFSIFGLTHYLAKEPRFKSACSEYGLSRTVLKDFMHEVLKGWPVSVIKAPPETPEAKEARRKYGRRELAKIKAMLNSDPQQGV